MSPPRPQAIPGLKRPGKRSTIDLQAKLKILKAFDEKPASETRVALASRLSIAVSTLQGIVKNRTKIEAASLQSNQKTKRLKTSPYESVEKALVHWILQAKALPVKPPLNGSVLKAQALAIAKKQGLTNFKATNGWLTRFRRRHGLAYGQVSGESADVDEVVAETWKTTLLPARLRGYQLCDMYNADEYGLFINLLPDKTMMLPGENRHGNKQSKARVTCLLASNATGTDKLTPLIIGKSKKPRCFQGVRSLPCLYKNQVNAWMDSTIFEWWIRKIDAQMRIAKRKIILFVDNCTAHPDVRNLTNVKLEFLPKNTTSKLQPMDQGIIKNLKHYYRMALVRRILGLIGKPNVEKKDCYINLFQAMTFVEAAWKNVTEETIFNCFRKAGFREVAQDEALPEEPRPSASQPRRRRHSDSDNESDVDDDLEELESGGEESSDRAVEANDAGVGNQDALSSGDESGAEDQLPVDDLITAGWDSVCQLLGVEGVVSFDAFVRADDGLQVHELLSVEAIADLHQVPTPGETSEEDAGDDGYGDPTPDVTTEQGLEAVGTIRRHLCQAPDLPHEYLTMLSKVEAFIVGIGASKKRQSVLDDYFPRLDS